MKTQFLRANSDLYLILWITVYLNFQKNTLLKIDIFLHKWSWRIDIHARVLFLIYIFCYFVCRNKVWQLLRCLLRYQLSLYVNYYNFTTLVSLKIYWKKVCFLIKYLVCNNLSKIYNNRARQWILKYCRLTESLSTTARFLYLFINLTQCINVRHRNLLKQYSMLRWKWNTALHESLIAQEYNDQSTTTGELFVPLQAVFLKQINFFGKHNGNLRNGALFEQAALEFPERATTMLERTKFGGCQILSGRQVALIMKARALRYLNGCSCFVPPNWPQKQTDPAKLSPMSCHCRVCEYYLRQNQPVP